MWPSLARKALPPQSPAPRQPAFALCVFFHPPCSGHHKRVDPVLCNSRCSVPHLVPGTALADTQGFPILPSPPLASMNLQALNHAGSQQLWSHLYGSRVRWGLPAHDPRVCVSGQVELLQGEPAPAFCTSSFCCVSKHAGSNEEEQPLPWFCHREVMPCGWHTVKVVIHERTLAWYCPENHWRRWVNHCPKPNGQEELLPFLSVCIS